MTCCTRIHTHIHGHTVRYIYICIGMYRTFWLRRSPISDTSYRTYHIARMCTRMSWL